MLSRPFRNAASPSPGWLAPLRLRACALCFLGLLLPACGAPRPAERKVLFVGLDGADWQLLDRYMAAGAMPNLAALVREGRSGVLRTLQPPLSPLLWTTMMTGRSPLDHGIFDFTRRDPATCDLEPIRSEDRKVPALWNIATSRKKSIALFGLWATYPAEPVDGLLVSDRFLSFTSGAGSGDAAGPGIVHPAERAGWAYRALTEADAALDAAALRAYLPGLTEGEAEAARAAKNPYAGPASGLRKVLLETRTYHRLATEWIAERKPDLSLVYFQGTDTLGHLFAPYAPPRQPSISEADFERYSKVPETYFREIDRMLGDYRKLAEKEGAVLVLASDHGFLWGEGRPAQLSSAAAPTAGRWHRSEGIYLLWGPGIEPSQERGRGEVSQLAATLLAALALPPGKGLAGPPLGGLPAAGVEMDYGPTYRPPAVDPKAIRDAETVEKLIALGYVTSTEAGKKLCPSAPRTAASFNNEGLLLRQKGDVRASAKAFERALANDSDNVSSLWNLSDLLHAEGRDADRSDQLLLRAVTLGLPEGVEHLAARAVDYGKRGQRNRALALLDDALCGDCQAPALLLLRGRFRLEAERCREAATDFGKVVAATPRDATAQGALGLARLCLGDSRGAAQALRLSLEIDPDQPQVRAALAGLGT